MVTKVRNFQPEFTPIIFAVKVDEGDQNNMIRQVANNMYFISSHFIKDKTTRQYKIPKPSIYDRTKAYEKIGSTIKYSYLELNDRKRIKLFANLDILVRRGMYAGFYLDMIPSVGVIGTAKSTAKIFMSGYFNYISDTNITEPSVWSLCYQAGIPMDSKSRLLQVYKVILPELYESTLKDFKRVSYPLAPPTDHEVINNDKIEYKKAKIFEDVEQLH